MYSIAPFLAPTPPVWVSTVHKFIVIVKGPPWLQFEPPQILKSDFDTCPDPDFDFDADMDRIWFSTPMHIQIHMDPHNFGKMDPDTVPGTHQSGEHDPNIASLY